MNLLLVGVGGVLGSFTRFELGRLVARRNRTHFPVGTLLINSSGAILLGVVSALPIGNNLLLFLADGFLGAYTTFSTFLFEGFELFRGDRQRNALVYILGSIIVGIAGYALGFAAARSIL